MIPQKGTRHFVEFNQALDDIVRTGLANEPFLNSKFHELEGMGPADPDYFYWVSLARLNELALLCAGNYADNCEFSAAGDLLVNPRLILVRSTVWPFAVKKLRHGRVTDQFVRMGKTREEVIQWVKNEVRFETVEAPLLPHLLELLKCSRHFTDAYLDSVGTRMQNIADTIIFLSSWRISSIEDLHIRLRTVSPSERRSIESNLCRFDATVFHALGKELPRSY